MNETKALERLVKDLLELSQLQSGKLSLLLVDVDLNEIASDAVRNMQTVADIKNIAIFFTHLEDIKPFKGDYDRLRQLFIIFIDNSIKHSQDNSKIEISIHEDEVIHIVIKDNGSGIPKEDLPYIFDRFYKVDKSRQEETSGTGLGLSIARHIVELHHGKIQVESEMGKGTRVEIILKRINI